MANSVDDLLVLSHFGIVGLSARPMMVIPVVWVPPQVGWVKLNTDGAILSSDLATGGGFFRDYRGKVVASFPLPLGIRSILKAKLMVVAFTIGKANELNISHLWIECEALLVVRLLQKLSCCVLWKVRALWDRFLS